MKNICTWKLTDTHTTHDRFASDQEWYDMDCEMGRWFTMGEVDDFEFCPYCGKKIREERQ